MSLVGIQKYKLIIVVYLYHYTLPLDKQVLRQFMAALHRYHTALHARQQVIQEQEALAYAEQEQRTAAAAVTVSTTRASLATSTASSSANSPAKHSQQQQHVSHIKHSVLSTICIALHARSVLGSAARKRSFVKLEHVGVILTLLANVCSIAYLHHTPLAVVLVHECRRISLLHPTTLLLLLSCITT
jgi:hypothetical protein